MCYVYMYVYVYAFSGTLLYHSEGIKWHGSSTSRTDFFKKYEISHKEIPTEYDQFRRSCYSLLPIL